MPDERPADLAAPAVPPEAYDRHYYLHWCAGCEAWRESEGAAIDNVYLGSLARAGLRPGEVLVDLGTGRGELLAAAVTRCDAARAIGIEYSPDAVEMARQTIARHGAGDRAEVLLADARAVPVEDGAADLVTLLDVVEHLVPAELAASLLEARRMLRPSGRLLIHTAPNRAVYETTYRWQRRLVPGRARRWPADPRNEFEHRMHVNEQTLRSLREAISAAGFQSVRTSLGAWVYAGFVPDERSRRLYGRLARVPGLRRLGVFDLWGEAVAP